MISIPASFPKFGPLHLQPMSGLMLSSNCIHLQPRRPILSTLSPRFWASKFTYNPSFPPALSFRVAETPRRFSTKGGNHFRREEFSAGSPNSESVEDIPHESDKLEISEPNVKRRNWATGFKEVIGSQYRVAAKRWAVPWAAETILQVILLWIASFWFVGSWMIPFGAHIVGFSQKSLTFRGQALLGLLTDVTEGLTGILVLHRCLYQYCPLPSGWFRFSLRGKWLVDVLLGCLMFPLVNRLSRFSLDLFPVLPSIPVTLSRAEQSMMAHDPIAVALYALVLVVCAPLWEEIVFRGFLLPSLTKYMPVWCSILVSSVTFSLAHFNVQRMLPLLFLGVVMGVIYVRSRNLFSSMLLHCLWNGFAFLDLMK